MTTSISQLITKGSGRVSQVLIRSGAIVALMFTLGSGTLGLLGAVGASGLVLATPTPAHANCLIGGENRADIADNDCLEAQRTGCVRHMLTPTQYKNCLQANAEAKAAGKTCIIANKIRNDLSELDCEEAKATGCVRRLLTDEQYANCLDAQTNQ